MITINSTEYSQTISEAIHRSRHALTYWRELIARYHITANDFVLLLSSDDEEIHYHTIRMLNICRKRKNIRRFLILSPDASMESYVRKHTSVPYDFVLCNKEDSDELSRLYNFYHYTDQLHISSFHLSADKDMFRLADNVHLTKKDLAALAVLDMDEVPTEEEIVTFSEASEIFPANISKYILYDMNVPTFPEGKSKLEEVVAHELDRLIECRKITKDDQLFLFGVTQTAKYAVKHLKDYHIAAYLDNNTDKIGTYADGIPVLSPSQYTRQQDARVKVLICSRKYFNICEQLSTLGYRIDRQVFVIFSFPPLRDASDAAFEEFLDSRIQEGKELYEQLRADYPSELLMIRPHPGTGDMYLLGGYIDRIVQGRPYVLTVPSNSIKNAAELFGINTIICPLDQAKKLLDFVRMVGFDELGVYSVNDNLNLPNPYQQIRIRTDLHTMFQRMVFGLDKKTTTFPFFQENSDHYFDTYRLVKGKTVLLSPYAGTTDTFSMGRWEQIASALHRRGYSVCTNVSGPNEAAIEGTLGLMLPYKQVIDFVTKAGGFIGLRNGLCDIISSTSSKMAVLYPKNGLGTPDFYYSYFSLEHMDLRHDRLLELVYETDLTDDDLQSIMDFITSEDANE